jgi:8-oxo-dGTP diphosphatase
MIEFPRGIEVVTGAIIENEKGEILIAQQPKWHSKWTLVGGHVKVGESILEAGVREAEEETGLTLKGITVIKWGECINSPDFDRPAHFVYFNIYCKVISGELKLEQKELSAGQWVLPEKAFELDLADTMADSITSFLEYKKHV